jgi:hypothetical protein
MALERQAATVFATVTQLRTTPGPRVAKYARTVEGNALWQFVPDDTTTVNHDDPFPTALDPFAATSGGYPGRWLRMATDRKGADLASGAATISITGGDWRVLPAATLGANSVLTLQTEDAVAGDTITVTRLDTEAFTYAIADEDSGTIVTLPVSESWFADFEFDGANWLLKRAGQMP